MLQETFFWNMAQTHNDQMGPFINIFWIQIFGHLGELLEEYIHRRVVSGKLLVQK